MINSSWHRDGFIFRRRGGQWRECDRRRHRHVTDHVTPRSRRCSAAAEVSMMAASNYYGFTHAAAAAAGPQYRYKINTCV